GGARGDGGAGRATTGRRAGRRGERGDRGATGQRSSAYRNASSEHLSRKRKDRRCGGPFMRGATENQPPRIDMEGSFGLNWGTRVSLRTASFHEPVQSHSRTT